MSLLPFGSPPIQKTAVTPGSYTLSSITVNQYGQLTAASSGSAGGTGTVTTVSITTANGISGTVLNPTTTPAISLSLAAITPTTVNGITLSGISTPTLAVTGTSTISGTNTGDQTTISGNAGTATKWATARNLAGNSVDGSANVAFANKFIVQGTTDTGLTGSQFLGALGTGLVKNTTTTGVLSIATQGVDYYAPGGTGVSVADGGTGTNTLAANNILQGNGTSAIGSAGLTAATAAGTTTIAPVTGNLALNASSSNLSLTGLNITLNGTSKVGSDTIATLTATQTLTGKTLTTPLISGSASVASTPATGFGTLFGVGTSTVRPHWINSSGSDETILTNYTTTSTFASISANFTTTSTTAVQVTGLSVTFTAVGSRPYKVTAAAPGLYNSVAANNTRMSIWNGTVGSGTQFAYTYGLQGGASATGGIAIGVITPSAGSVTVNVGLQVGAGTGTIEAAATGNAYLIVEPI